GHWIQRGRIEAERDIKPARVLGNCMDHHSSNSDRVGRMSYPARRISKHRPAQSATLLRSIDGEPAQHRDRNGIRHVPAKLTCNGSLRDRSRGEGVIAHDPPAVPDNTSTGRPSNLVPHL